MATFNAYSNLICAVSYANTVSLHVLIKLPYSHRKKKQKIDTFLHQSHQRKDSLIVAGLMVTMHKSSPLSLVSWQRTIPK